MENLDSVASALKRIGLGGVSSDGDIDLVRCVQLSESLLARDGPPGASSSEYDLGELLSERCEFLRLRLFGRGTMTSSLVLRLLLCAISFLR